MNREIIYRIVPFDILTPTLRIASLVSIIFIIYFFHLNYIVFSIFLIIAISILIFSRTTKITLTGEFLLIEHRNIIPKMSYVKSIGIKDISQIEFEKEDKKTRFKYLLPHGYMITSKDNTIFIRLKNNTDIKLIQVGTKKQFIGLLDVLSELIKNNQALTKTKTNSLCRGFSRKLVKKKRYLKIKHQRKVNSPWP